MNALEFTDKIKSLALKRNDISIDECSLNYKNSSYTFLRIFSKNIKKDDKIFLICAGIHGDEIAGPLTILKYFDDIIDYTHKNKLKLIIYPLRNPSGFDKNTRYNIDNDTGYFRGNNVLMFYKLKDRITDDIMDSNNYLEWNWCLDANLKIPDETRLISRLLKKDPLKQVKAVLDIHQDCLTPNMKGGAYHYSFGDLNVYDKIIDRIERIIPVLRNKDISAGYDRPMKTDNNGFIIRHDGSISDLLYRLNVKYNVACETFGDTDLDKACKVNLIWIKGLIDLASKK